jgi:predicted transcriptional regulator
MDLKSFELIGVNECEAKIFKAILELGDSVVSRIADKAEIKRTTAYLALRNLKRRGLIGQAKRKGRMYYYADDLNVLEKIVEEKTDGFLKMLPELKSIAKLVDYVPNVVYYDDGMFCRKIYDDIIKNKKHEVLSCFNDAVLKNQDYTEYFSPQRIKQKISLKSIILNSSIDKYEKNFINLHEIKNINKKWNNWNIEIYIYDKSKIGIISRNDFALIINSKNIHNMVKEIYNYLWEDSL